MQVNFARALVLASALGAFAAQAQPLPPQPSGVLTLSTSASVEVTKDVLAVAFSVTREGADAQAVQSGLKQALDAALAEARKVAKPGQVDVQTGNFSLYPRYGNPGKGGQPVINGWQGTAELMVQGKDIPAIAQLSGRIQTMTIANVGYTLSRDCPLARQGGADGAAVRLHRLQRARGQRRDQRFPAAAGADVDEIGARRGHGRRGAADRGRQGRRDCDRQWLSANDEVTAPDATRYPPREASARSKRGPRIGLCPAAGAAPSRGSGAAASGVGPLLRDPAAVDVEGRAADVVGGG
jgi:predicted secreted protein